MYFRKKQKHKILPKDKKELRAVLDEQITQFLDNSSEIQKVRKGLSGEKFKEFEENKKRYHDYVTKDSDRWKNKKEEAFNARGQCCQVCAATKDLQVHHNNYRTLLFENVMEDLIVLCKDCHHHFHSHIPAKDLGVRHKKTDCSFCSSGKKPKFAITFKGDKGPLVHMCYRCQGIFKEKLSDTRVVAEIEDNIELFKKQAKDKLISKELRAARPLMRIRKSNQNS